MMRCFIFVLVLAVIVLAKPPNNGHGKVSTKKLQIVGIIRAPSNIDLGKIGSETSNESNVNNDDDNDDFNGDGSEEQYDDDDSDEGSLRYNIDDDIEDDLSNERATDEERQILSKPKQLLKYLRKMLPNAKIVSSRNGTRPFQNFFNRNKPNKSPNDEDENDGAPYTIVIQPFPSYEMPTNGLNSNYYPYPSYYNQQGHRTRPYDYQKYPHMYSSSSNYYRPHHYKPSSSSYSKYKKHSKRNRPKSSQHYRRTHSIYRSENPTFVYHKN